MIDQIIERLFFHLGDVCWHCNHILISASETPLALEKTAEKILHIVKMRYNAIFHRKNDQNVIGSFLEHFICLIARCVDISFILHRYSIFFPPNPVFLFIKYLDLICPEIKPINIPQHLYLPLLKLPCSSSLKKPLLLQTYKTIVPYDDMIKQ